jgi:hypothetical protein
VEYDKRHDKIGSPWPLDSTDGHVESLRPG